MLELEEAFDLVALGFAAPDDRQVRKKAKKAKRAAARKAVVAEQGDAAVEPAADVAAPVEATQGGELSLDKQHLPESQEARSDEDKGSIVHAIDYGLIENDILAMLQASRRGNHPKAIKDESTETIDAVQTSPDTEPPVPADRPTSPDLTTDSSIISAPRRQIRYKLVRRRLPHNPRRSRVGIRVYRPPPSSASTRPTSPSVPDETLEPTKPTKPDIPPGHLNDVYDALGEAVYDAVLAQTKENSSTGNPLPSAVRDLFPALDDLPTAIHMVNSVRKSYGLPKLGLNKKNRIAAVRAVAKVRESLYTALSCGLLLPLGPKTPPRQNESDEAFTASTDTKLKISLTPMNLEIMAKSLKKAFPWEKAALKAFLADEQAAYGEQHGKAVWQGGVGRVSGAEGGFRGKISTDGDTHIFIDHSNILYGLLHCLYPSSSTSLPPRHLRTLSLPLLSLLLRRGRYTPPGTLHTVASSPLKQNLDDLVRLGWEVSILKRVELFSDEVEDPTALSLASKPMDKVSTGEGFGLRRYKEQAVDEILHLKLLQALNAKDGHGQGCTIVLATGDAKGGQFNRDGFLGAVREALRRGWNVELWSFKAGLSRAWKETAKREHWFDDNRFNVYTMDEWAEQLVEVVDDYNEL